MNITIKPYEWEVHEDELWIWALDKESKMTLIRIMDMYHTLYVELPGGENVWTIGQVKRLEKYLDFTMSEHPPISVSREYRKTLYYYQRHARVMAKIKLSSADSARHCKRLLNKEERKIGGRNYKFTVYESHVPILRQFWSIRQITPTDWLDITCHSVLNTDHSPVTVGSDIPEYLASYKYVNKSEYDGHVSMRICDLDIETAGKIGQLPLATMPNFEVKMISCCFYNYKQEQGMRRVNFHTVDLPPSDDDVELLKFDNEVDMIIAWATRCQVERVQMLCGYNLMNFDLPYLGQRLAFQGDKMPNFGYTRSPNHIVLKDVYCKYGMRTQVFPVSGIITVDTMHQVMSDLRQEPTYMLNEIAKKVLGKTKNDVPYERMFEIFEAQKEQPGTHLDEMNDVRKYNDMDVLLDKELFEHFHTQTAIMERAMAFNILPKEVNIAGAEQTCESLLYDRAMQNGFVINELNKYDPEIRKWLQTFIEGGYVSVPVRGHKKNCVCDDFSSLYPSLMRDNNLCYTTLEKPEAGGDVLAEDECRQYDVVQTEPLYTKAELREYGLALEEQDSDDDSQDSGDEHDAETGPKKKKTLSQMRKMKKTGRYTHRFAKHTVQHGLVPQIVADLVAKRTIAKKAVKIAKTDLDKAVMDQRQLGYKLAANSMYGYVAMGLLGKRACPEVAMTITFLGRTSIIKCGNYMVEKHDCTLIYGDSVTPDTPVFVKCHDTVYLTTIDSIVDEKAYEPYHGDKEFVDLRGQNISIWADGCFVPLEQVIRHRYRGPIWRVITDAGLVDCTPDHSLLTNKDVMVAPKDVHENDLLKFCSWLPRDIETMNHGLSLSKITCMQQWLFLERRGYKIKLSQCGRLLEEGECKGIVYSSKIHEQNYDGFVYDLTTVKHMFHVGPGRLVVHNTDSIFYIYNDRTLTTQEVQEKAEQHALELTSFIRDSDADGFERVMNMECEKVMDIYNHKKKNYAYIVANKQGEYPYNIKDIKIKGLPPTRRDNCKWLSDMYLNVKLAGFKGASMSEVFDIIYDQIIALIRHKVDKKKLVTSIKLNKEYNSSSAPMAVFRDHQRSLGVFLEPKRYALIIVKPKTKDEPIGKRFRLANPMPDEAPDPLYYLQSMFHKPMDKSLNVIFMEEYEKLLPRAKPILIKKKKIPITNVCEALTLAYQNKQDPPLSCVRDWYRSQVTKL